MHPDANKIILFHIKLDILPAIQPNAPMKKPRVAYVTYVVDPADPDIDLDMEIFLRALAMRDINAAAEVWDDPRADWASYDMALVRSTWDYTRQREKYLEWARRVSAVTRLVNPYEVLSDNTDKRYLLKIAECGVPIIPTLFLDGPADLKEEFPGMEAGWVVKPVVDAGARGASRHAEWKSVAETVRAHFTQSAVPLMLQPYLPEVDTDGEIAVICCRGVPTHAVIKKPALSEGGHGDFAGKAEITATLRAFVEKALSLPVSRGTYADLLYARVDVVPRDGGFLLMELEATEPYLFLPSCESSAEVFADAVEAML